MKRSLVHPTNVSSLDVHRISSSPIKIAISYPKRIEIALYVLSFSHQTEFVIALWLGHELVTLMLSVDCQHQARLARAR